MYLSDIFSSDYSCRPVSMCASCIKRRSFLATVDGKLSLFVPLAWSWLSITSWCLYTITCLIIWAVWLGNPPLFVVLCFSDMCFWNVKGSNFSVCHCLSCSIIYCLAYCEFMWPWLYSCVSFLCWDTQVNNSFLLWLGCQDKCFSKEGSMPMLE